MPHKDPDKRRQVKRDSARRARVRAGTGLDDLAEALQRLDELPEPPSREALMRALGVQAAAGNVPAIRLLLEEYRRDGNSDDEQSKDPFGEADEVARKRAERAVGT